MDFVRGSVVRAKAGRDKEGFFVVLESKERYVLICDGSRRSLKHPKKKNILHLALTKSVLDEDSMKTDRAIRKALRSFAPAGAEDSVPLEEGS